MDKTPKQKRSDILMKLADNLEKHFDELVKAESKDNGGEDSFYVDIQEHFANIRFFAGYVYIMAQKSTKWTVLCN